MAEIPEEAQRLHQQARAAGGRGDYDTALSLLNEAHQAAPDWPYPLYDAAFTYLLQGDSAQAEQLYAMVDEMAPRGFFTCQTSLHILRREHAGELFEGFSKAYATLEWMEPEKKRGVLLGIVAKYPDFAPAWKELVSLLDPDPEERLRVIENGLAGRADAETRGMLLLNKALQLRQLHREDEATAILHDLAEDPASPLDVEALAKNLLAGWPAPGTG